MRTASGLCRTRTTVYQCELVHCPQCGQELEEVNYWNGLKTVQTMSEVKTIAYRPKGCPNAACDQIKWSSANWQRIAPKYSIFGYDVIAKIGWQRQKERMDFGRVHTELSKTVQISASQVRYLYNQSYLPLLACHERQHLNALEVLAYQSGLILGLDGLMPEGGEPQLWLVRELRSGWTLRSGWMTRQDEAAFVEFLQPIADLGLPVNGIISDKQRGLLPAIEIVFKNVRHGFCQVHYLNNAAEPLASADEQMKIELRQAVRAEVGDLLRHQSPSSASETQPNRPVVTGMIPSPLPTAESTPLEPEQVVEQEQEKIVQELLMRVRYLLTLKGRPPFRLAGIEMFARLQELVACVQALVAHQPEPRLLTLLVGLQKALAATLPQYLELSQASTWLAELANILDPDGKPARTGAQVQAEWQACLSKIETQPLPSTRLQEFSAKICKVSQSYASGLFHTYDIPGLPRTNNGRETDFRQLRHRLLSTTGQVGATKRLLLRAGAWELLPSPPSLSETISTISNIPPDQFSQERQRVRLHRAPFRLHTRSPRLAESQLKRITAKWTALPAQIISS
jgi:hypothetical protein